MAARVKTKVMTQNKEEISKLMSQLMDPRKAEPDIIIPKCKEAREIMDECGKVLTQLGSSSGLLYKSFPDMKEDFDQVVNFVAKMREFIEIDTLPDEKITDKNIHELYLKIKTGSFTKELITTCGKINEDITNIQELNLTFISNIPDFIYQPLTFCNLNFYDIWAQSGENNGPKKYILKILAKLHSLIKELHEIVTSPDVNLDEMSTVIIEALTRIKTVIPGCEDAFKIIGNSVGMLKDNFGTYYKDFVVSKNPNTLFESFLVDVATKGKFKGLKLRSQFAKIINYIRQKASEGGQIKDPNVINMFNILEQNMDTLKKAEEEKKPTVDIKAPTEKGRKDKDGERDGEDDDAPVTDALRAAAADVASLP
jgi:hypothetical protein